MEFLRQTEAGVRGKAWPKFIKQEFSDFLKCGILAYGFVRVRCYHCATDQLVAFSCKRRGFCPSCTARRMNELSAHLVDNVLPDKDMRQWVLSLPYEIRYLLAHNPSLTSLVLREVTRRINRWYKSQARKRGYKTSYPGAVTFIHRFGSAVNLNVHFHTIFLDGVYVDTPGGGLNFLKVSLPRPYEIQEIVESIADKVYQVLKKKGFNRGDDQLSFNEYDGFDEIKKSAILLKSQFGERAGMSLRKYGKKVEIPPDEEHGGRRSLGFSLHPHVAIKAGNRKKLEKLLRYMGRGPVAIDRLTLAPNGDVIYRLKKMWRSGVSHIAMSPLDFIAKLVSLVPPPRAKLIRYHGIFAPNAKRRSEIIPKTIQDVEVGASNQAPQAQRLTWAEMLRRVFKIDVMECQECKGRLEQVATIKDGKVVRAILKSMDLPTSAPLLVTRSPRGPPNTMGLRATSEHDQRPDAW